MPGSQAQSQAKKPFPANRRLTPQQVIAVLSACLALQMTSYAMMLPLFARRFNEFGAGVEALGTSDMAFALTSMLAAPFMGALADRFGRRPLILGSLAAYVVAYLGFLLAPAAWILILLRGLAGGFTAGLMPAVTGLAADLAPRDRRAQWMGFVSGGAAVGWIAGPVVGGMVFDRWGYAAALVVSTITASATFVVALLAVPESRQAHHSLPAGKTIGELDGRKSINVLLSDLRSTLPYSLPAFFVLLFIYFAVMFAWAFISPELMFYAYNDLGWSSSFLGLVMSAYAVAMMLGEFSFGRLSDRWGRKPVILLGLVLFSAQFIGLGLSQNYILIAVTFIIAGMGNALYDPAISAAVLDISPAEHSARNLGIRYMAGSTGNILGPALIVLVTSRLNSSFIFLVGAGVVVLAIITGMGIKTNRHPEEAPCKTKGIEAI